MQLKKLTDLDLANKRVLLRVDYNLPMDDGKIIDDFKIKESLPTIKYLLKKKCQIILVSHLGRPGGKRIRAMSLVPVFMHFKKIAAELGYSAIFIDDKLGVRINAEIKKLKQPIIFLENLRFDPGEEKNSREFSELLADLGEVYVNDAFAVSHRKAASIVGVTDFLPSAAGLRLEKEIEFLSKALKPETISVAVLGGAKVSTKLPLVRKMLQKYNFVLTGGGLANNLLAAKGYDVGGSEVETKMLRYVKSVSKSRKLILPLDLVIADKATKDFVKVVKVGEVKVLCKKNEVILDVGPKTILAYSQKIKTAKTIVWNGPLGLIEMKKYSHASIVIAKSIGARASGKALGIAGGGETNAVIESSGMARYYDFISTGGGAMLEFLQGKSLPGIKALMR